MMRARRLNMKIAALDLGDAWVGIALSDAMKISCKPYTTVARAELEGMLASFIAKESVTTVVVGYPVTVSAGTVSQQTEKIHKEFQALAQTFAIVAGQAIDWALWDERFSSQYAATLHKRGFRTKEEKMQSHAIAAAFILQNYLDHLAFKAS